MRTWYVKAKGAARDLLHPKMTDTAYRAYVFDGSIASARTIFEHCDRHIIFVDQRGDIIIQPDRDVMDDAEEQGTPIAVVRPGQWIVSRGFWSEYSVLDAQDFQKLYRRLWLRTAFSAIYGTISSTR